MYVGQTVKIIAYEDEHGTIYREKGLPPNWKKDIYGHRGIITEIANDSSKYKFQVHISEGTSINCTINEITPIMREYFKE